MPSWGLVGIFVVLAVVSVLRSEGTVDWKEIGIVSVLTVIIYMLVFYGIKGVT